MYNRQTDKKKIESFFQNKFPKNMNNKFLFLNNYLFYLFMFQSKDKMFFYNYKNE